MTKKYLARKHPPLFVNSALLSFISLVDLTKYTEPRSDTEVVA